MVQSFLKVWLATIEPEANTSFQFFALAPVNLFPPSYQSLSVQTGQEWIHDKPQLWWLGYCFAANGWFRSQEEAAPALESNGLKLSA